MTDLASKTCTVIDNGLFVGLAIRLAREDGFGKVNYWSPYECAFPRWNEYDVGRGFAGVTRLDSFASAYGKTHLWVVPDTYHAPLAKFLRDECGQRVWAAFDAERLELDRVFGLEKMDELGIGVPETEIVTGVTELKTALKRYEVCWVKTSFTRGEGETWKHGGQGSRQECYARSLAHIDNVVVPRLGVNKEERVFLLVEHIEGIEAGGDQLTVDGQHFDHAMYGYEVKGVYYVGALKAYDRLPAVVRDYDAKLAPYLKECGARTFASSEIRTWKRNTGVAIDPCLRLGNPPFQAMIEAYGNLPELLYAGAGGEVLPVEVVDPYWAICMLESEEANEAWTPLDMPKDLRQWVKLRFCCQVGGTLGIIPQSQKVPMLGGAVGHGKTLAEAMEAANGVAEECGAFGLIAHHRESETAERYVEEGRKYGIEF